MLQLEFEVKIHIHKHENSEVIYSNRNKSPKEMSENSRLQNHGKYVNRFRLTKYTGYISQTNNFMSLWMRYGSTQVTQIPLVHSAKLVANRGNTASVVDVIEDDKLMFMPQQPDDLPDSHHCYYIMGQCHNNVGAIRRPLGNQLNQAAPDCMQAQ